MDFFTLTLFVVFFILSLTSAFEEIKVKPGDDVTLHCQSPGGEAITRLEWSRLDLDPEKDGYVFFYRNNRPYEPYQQKSFRRRVQLRDPEMKNGDVSVILNNVNINDTGTYKCRTAIRNTEGITETTDVNFLTLTLDEGQKDGPNGIVVGVSVTAVLLLLGIFSFIYIRKRREPTRTSYQSPPETGSVPLQQ